MKENEFCLLILDAATIYVMEVKKKEPSKRKYPEEEE